MYLVTIVQEQFEIIQQDNLENRIAGLRSIHNEITYNHGKNKILCSASVGLLPIIADIIQTKSGEDRLLAVCILRDLALDITSKSQIELVASPLRFVSLILKVIQEGDGDLHAAALRTIVRMSFPSANKFTVASEPELISTIANVIRTCSGESRNFAVWVIWKLSESEMCAPIVTSTGIFKELLDIIKTASGYPAVTNFGGNNIEFNTLMAIFSMAEHEISRPILTQLGAVAVLEPMTAYDTLLSLMGSLAYVFLVGRNEDSSANEDTQSGLAVIRRVIDVFQSAILNEDGEGYKAGVFTIPAVIRAMYELSLSDGNKKQVAIPKVRDLLVRIIRDVKYRELEVSTIPYYSVMTSPVPV
jgi:hypothetical protein